MFPNNFEPIDRGPKSKIDRVTGLQLFKTDK